MKTNVKFVFVSLVLFVLSLLLSGCYLNDDVKTDQVGVQLDGGRIKNCVGPGVYSDSGWFADLVEVPAGTLTFQVEDPEVATQDNQLVGVKITIQARRNADCDSVKNLLTNWPSLIADQSLIDTVSATAREAIKNGTRSFTLEGLLDDRNGLASAIVESLETDATNYGIQIINVTIENVALDPDYAAQLQEKALLTAKIETELRRQDLIKQQASNDALSQEQRKAVLDAQLLAEKAQTSVELEIAGRAGKVIAAQNAVYLDNVRAFELERLRLLEKIFGEKSVFYFLPVGTDLSLLFGMPPGTVVVPDNTSGDSGATGP